MRSLFSIVLLPFPPGNNVGMQSIVNISSKRVFARKFNFIMKANGQIYLYTTCYIDYYDLISLVLSICLNLKLLQVDV